MKEERNQGEKKERMKEEMNEGEKEGEYKNREVEGERNKSKFTERQRKENKRKGFKKGRTNTGAEFNKREI